MLKRSPTASGAGTALSGPFSVTLPCRPDSKLDGPNARLDRWTRHRRNKAWGFTVFAALREAGWPRLVALRDSDWRVTFRVSQARGPIADTDNQVGMLKQVRDSVAAYLGVGDGPTGIEWRYEPWERGPDRTRIELERAP